MPRASRAQDGDHLAEGLGLGEAERVAREIAALSGGRIQVKVFAANEMVGAFESFEAVPRASPTCIMAQSIPREVRSPAFGYFAAVPFGFTAAEMNAWVYLAGTGAMGRVKRRVRAEAVHVRNTGAQMGGWFTKEITASVLFGVCDIGCRTRW